MALLTCALLVLVAYAAYRLARLAVIWAYAKFIADPFLGYRGDRAR